jgi:AcrR family transcriptional regulator
LKPFIGVPLEREGWRHSAPIQKKPPLRTVGTRDRLVRAGINLFRRQGFHATGINEILREADARCSSLYHHFPGGKVQLAVAVIAAAGTDFQGRVDATWDAHDDAVHGIREVFEVAADELESTDYAGICPIGTIAPEVAGTSTELRMAVANGFEERLESVSRRLVAAGASDDDATAVSHTIIAMLEGAFLLCRTLKDTAPMRDAARVAATLVDRALGRRAL